MSIGDMEEEFSNLSYEARDAYAELIDESDIEEFCEEYDSDYNNADERKRGIVKYIEQIPFEPHVVEALDEESQKRYYQLKWSIRTYHHGVDA